MAMVLRPTGDELETPQVDPGACPPGDVVAWVMQMLARRGHELRPDEQGRQMATSAAGTLLHALGVDPVTSTTIATTET
jgi:hypothetical protein